MKISLIWFELCEFHLSGCFVLFLQLSVGFWRQQILVLSHAVMCGPVSFQHHGQQRVVQDPGELPSLLWR